MRGIARAIPILGLATTTHNVTPRLIFEAGSIIFRAERGGRLHFNIYDLCRDQQGSNGHIVLEVWDIIVT